MGNTPLHLAATNGHLQICMIITKNSNEKAPRNSSGKTPLHFAAQYGYFDVCKFLIENVVDKNQGDKNGITPLHLAAKFGQLEICRLIIEVRTVLVVTLLFAQSTIEHSLRCL